MLRVRYIARMPRQCHVVGRACSTELGRSNEPRRFNDGGGEARARTRAWRQIRSRSPTRARVRSSSTRSHRIDLRGRRSCRRGGRRRRHLRRHPGAAWVGDLRRRARVAERTCRSPAGICPAPCTRRRRRGSRIRSVLLRRRRRHRSPKAGCRCLRADTSRRRRSRGTCLRCSAGPWDSSRRGNRERRTDWSRFRRRRVDRICRCRSSRRHRRSSCTAGCTSRPCR